MPEEHATLSASGSAKWLGCPAALALEALINEPDTGSEWANEGTAAHEVLEMCLTDKLEPSSFLDQTIDLDNGDDYRIVTQNMVDAVEVAVEYIGRLTAVNAFYEERVDYSHIAPNGFGTADVVLEVYEKVSTQKRVNTLYVLDYKHGAGVRVDAFENSQGMLYGLGALNSLDVLFEREIERVVIVIMQPRMDNISEFEISVKDLEAWGEKIKPKAQRAYDLYEKAKGGSDDIFSPQNFNPSKKGCRWCQGARLKKCKAYAHSGYSAAVEGFDDLTKEEKADLPSVKVNQTTVKDPAFLDNADLAAIHKSMGIFLSFAAGLDDEIRRRIEAGELVPGLALIDTEKNRAWKDDEEATIKALRTSGLQKKDYEKINIISPTEAEKRLKKVKPKDHKRRYKRLEVAAIHRPPGAQKIVEDDTVTTDGFDDIDDLLS